MMSHRDLNRYKLPRVLDNIVPKCQTQRVAEHNNLIIGSAHNGVRGRTTGFPVRDATGAL